MNPPPASFADVRAVLFDLDGTLLDSAPDLGLAADQMRLVRGMTSLPAALYRPMAGQGAKGMLAVALGVTPEHAHYEALREEFFGNYQALLTQNTHPFQDVPELIAQLNQKGLPWGVVTNKIARFTEPLTRATGLFASAQTIISGDTTAHTKPHPAPLQEAAQRLGIKPAHCLYVGDDERDITAGLAAGMHTVAAAYGYLGQHAPVEEWGAHAIIESPLALLALLK